jgi:uncharacterized membrane protein YfhO
MTTTRTKQSGFGIVTVIVALVVILAIGGTGFAIYKHNKKDTKSDSTQTTASKPKNTTADNSQTAQPATQYLVIKEWGIQVPLSDPIKDAYYVVSNSSSDANGNPDSVWLSLASLKDKGCDANLANQGQSQMIGSLFRVTPDTKEPVSGTLYTELFPDGITIGNYYYGYKSWSKDKTCTSRAVLDAFDAAFESSIKSATAAPTR